MAMRRRKYPVNKPPQLTPPKPVKRGSRTRLRKIKLSGGKPPIFKGPRRRTHRPGS